MELSTVKMPALNALDSIAQTASRKTGGAAADGGSFADMIRKSLESVNQSQASAESLSHQYQLDQNGVSLEDAMIAAQKANISFQTTVQVRNKLVTAYNDIMNMPL